MDRVGQQLGNWLLVRLLGQGSFGQVYEARNAATDLRAAVKILTSPGADVEQARKGFLKEARAANAAKHDGIVQVYDAGESPDGLLYLVMELVDGKTLSKELAEAPGGRLPAERVMALGARISAALAAVHAHGVVHRDLKPDNVFVAGGDAIKILDFGIAKLRSTLAAVTQGPPMIMGTPMFMAPEQWRADPNIDGRADIYSLGNMLFLLATGSSPFRAASVEQWMYAHLNQEPLTAAEIPPALASLIGRMLQKNPDARPRDMTEVAAELQGDRRPTLVRSPARAPRKVLRVALPLALVAALVPATMFAWRVRTTRRLVACRESIRLRQWSDAAETCRVAAAYEPSLLEAAGRAQSEAEALQRALSFARLLSADLAQAATQWSTIPPDTDGAAIAAQARDKFVERCRAAAQAALANEKAPCATVEKQLALIEKLGALGYGDRRLQKRACPQPKPPAGHGWITVSSTPADAQVYLADQPSCRANPTCQIQHLAGGTYQVEVRKDGFKAFSAALLVNDGSEVQLAAALQPCPSPPAACSD